MELIEHEELSEELKDFPFPSNEKKIIRGPDDISRGQAKELGRLFKEHQDDDEDDFVAMIFLYWARLPATSWNLARNRKPLPLTAETLEAELKKGDFATLAQQVAKHLYPNMFQPPTDSDDEGDGDVMDGLEAEDGSDAAQETPDPNP